MKENSNVSNLKALTKREALGKIGQIKKLTSTTLRIKDLWWIQKMYGGGLPEFVERYVEVEMKEHEGHY